MFSLNFVPHKAYPLKKVALVLYYINFAISIKFGMSFDVLLDKVVRGDWRRHICPLLQDDLRRFRQYRGTNEEFDFRNQSHVRLIPILNKSP